MRSSSSASPSPLRAARARAAGLVFFVAAAGLTVPPTTILAGAPAAPAPGVAAATPASIIAAITAASDARFDGPESAEARELDLQEMTGAAAEHPDCYEILWRAARAAWAVGDRLDEQADSDRLERMGRSALDWAERAVAANPDGIEGRFYRGLAVSVYARGIGMLRALFKGLGGKFESDMEFVTRKDPRWGYGAGYRALGRYYYRLPRPKRDLGKSERLLRQSVTISPDWLRTHLYLADTLQAQGRQAEAEREYRFVLDHRPDPGEGNELETVRGDARRALAGLRRG